MRRTLGLACWAALADTAHRATGPRHNDVALAAALRAARTKRADGPPPLGAARRIVAATRTADIQVTAPTAVRDTAAAPLAPTDRGVLVSAGGVQPVTRRVLCGNGAATVATARALLNTGLAAEGAAAVLSDAITAVRMQAATATAAALVDLWALAAPHVDAAFVPSEATAAGTSPPTLGDAYWALLGDVARAPDTVAHCERWGVAITAATRVLPSVTQCGRHVQRAFLAAAQLCLEVFAERAVVVVRGGAGLVPFPAPLLPRARAACDATAAHAQGLARVVLRAALREDSTAAADAARCVLFLGCCGTTPIAAAAAQQAAVRRLDAAWDEVGGAVSLTAQLLPVVLRGDVCGDVDGSVALLRETVRYVPRRALAAPDAAAMQLAHQGVVAGMVRQAAAMEAPGCAAKLTEAYVLINTHKYHGLRVTKELVGIIGRSLVPAGDSRLFNLVDVCTLFSGERVDVPTLCLLFEACAAARDHHRARTLLALLQESSPGILPKLAPVHPALVALQVLPARGKTWLADGVGTPAPTGARRGASE